MATPTRALGDVPTLRGTWKGHRGLMMSRNDNRLVSWAQRSDRACCLGTSEGCLEEVAFELESRTGQRVGFVWGSQNG